MTAYDARTGKQLWLYDPKVPGEWNVNICLWNPHARPSAAWNGKIIVGTLDGRLVALVRRNRKGSLVGEHRRQRVALLHHGTGTRGGRQVFIGNAGADFGVRGM